MARFCLDFYTIEKEVLEHSGLVGSTSLLIQLLLLLWMVVLIAEQNYVVRVVKPFLRVEVTYFMKLSQQLDPKDDRNEVTCTKLLGGTGLVNKKLLDC